MAELLEAESKVRTVKHSASPQNDPAKFTVRESNQEYSVDPKDQPLFRANPVVFVTNSTKIRLLVVMPDKVKPDHQNRIIKPGKQFTFNFKKYFPTESFDFQCYLLEEDQAVRAHANSDPRVNPRG